MEGVGLDIRANMAPAGRSTRDIDREANEPGRCSTRRSWERSGFTQAGTALSGALGMMVEGVITGLVEELNEFFLPFVTEGIELLIAAGDMMVERRKVVLSRQRGGGVCVAFSTCCQYLTESAGSSWKSKLALALPLED